MTKKKRSCLVLFIAAIVIIVALFYIQKAKYAREGLLHALNIEKLPPSTKIIGADGESWTDYLFEADVQISPDDCDAMLAGRDFAKESLQFYYDRPVTGHWIRNFKPFKATEIWEWPEQIDDERVNARCRVFINESRNRIYVNYMSD